MKDSQPQVNTIIRLYFIHHDTFQWSELSMTVEVQCVFFFLFSFLFFSFLFATKIPWQVVVRDNYHEENKCADRLRDKGSSQLQREILYDTCSIYFFTSYFWNLWDHMGTSSMT